MGTDAAGTKPRGPWEVFVKTETSAYTHIQPVAADVLTVLQDECDFSDVQVPTRTPINESRRDRGNRSFSDGQLTIPELKIGTRLLGSGIAGAETAAMRALLNSACGLNRNVCSSQSKLEVADYTQGGTETLIVTVVAANGVVTATTLTNGTEFTAATSNEATATAIAAAISALDDVTATASGAIVTVTCDVGTRDVGIVSSEVAFVRLYRSATAEIALVDYTEGTTDTITIVTEVNGSQTTTVLTEGTDFDAESSDAQTAANITAAVSITGFSASAGGTSTATITASAGYHIISVVCSDDGFATTSLPYDQDAEDRCYYSADDDDPAGTVSVDAFDSLGISAVQYSGVICEQIETEKAGGESDFPKLRFSCLAARRIEYEATTLAAAIASTDGTSMTIANPVTRIRTGLSDVSETLTGLYYTIAAEGSNTAEVVKITAINKTTGVCTIARAQCSTSGSLHANAATLTPYRPTATYQEAGIEIGGQMSAFVAYQDGSSVRLRGQKVTQKTGRAYDDLQSGATSPDSDTPQVLEGNAEVEFIRTLTRQQIARTIETGSTVELATVYGSTAGSIWGFVLPVCQAKKSESKLAQDEPTVSKIPFDLLDNAVGTTPSLSGKFQIYLS